MPASAYAGVCLIFLSLFGSYPHAGCRFFAGSSSSLLFFVEFFLLLLLLVIMSFYLRLSVATPHSVAPARRVYLFACDLPGSSLCLLVCLHVLLGGVILGFSGSGCSSGWLVWCPLSRSRFLSVVWTPLCLLPGFLAGCSWFLPGGRFPFCWLLSGAPGFQPLAPGAIPGWRLCLSWLPS